MSTQEQTKNRETFAALADEFGAEETLRMFRDLHADPQKLNDAYQAYIATEMRERWDTVYNEGETAETQQGLDPSGYWSSTTKYLTWDGSDYEAEIVATEAKTHRVLRQYDPSSEGWDVVWDEEENH